LLKKNHFKKNPSYNYELAYRCNWKISKAPLKITFGPLDSIDPRDRLLVGWPSLGRSRESTFEHLENVTAMFAK
jgi:hypothetical protein